MAISKVFAGVAAEGYDVAAFDRSYSKNSYTLRNDSVLITEGPTTAADAVRREELDHLQDSDKDGSTKREKDKGHDWIEMALMLDIQIRWLRDQADALHAKAVEMELIREAAQAMQDGAFRSAEELSDLLAQEELDKDAARHALKAMGVGTPADADEGELTVLIERERQRLLLRAEAHQKEIDYWNEKIDEARTKAEELRNKADDLEAWKNSLGNDPTLSDEERAVQLQIAETKAAAEIALIKEMNAEEPVAEQQEEYLQSREGVIHSYEQDFSQAFKL